MASKFSGELMLISEVIAVRSPSPPSAANSSSHIATESRAREGSVTEPMNGLSDSVMCAISMSRWRLLTAMSVGSQTVPPECCSHFEL